MSFVAAMYLGRHSDADSLLRPPQDRLLDTTLRSRMIEKLSVALHDCIFQPSEDEVTIAASLLDSRVLIVAHTRSPASRSQPERLMSEHDHLAIVSVNAFLQNLYFYATHRNDEYRQHLLSDTLLVSVFPFDKSLME